MGGHVDAAAGARPTIIGSAGFFVPGALAAAVAKLLEQGDVWARQNAIPVPAGVGEVLAVARIAALRNAEARLAGSTGIPAESPSATIGAEMMTTAQVASRCGCSTRNVTGLAARGTLPGRRHPRRGWRFHPDDVAAYLAAREETNGRP